MNGEPGSGPGASRADINSGYRPATTYDPTSATPLTGYDPAPAPLADPATPRQRSVVVNPRTPWGATALAGMLLLGVAGLLAVLAALDVIGDPGNDSEAVIVLVMGIVALVCALIAVWGWTAPAGILGMTTGVVFVTIFPETAGILAVLGGIVLLVVHFLPKNL